MVDTKIAHIPVLFAEKAEDLQKNSLSSLPLGAIRCPDGWLGQQLRLMTGGMTGRLPEYSPYFRPAVNGFLNPEVNSGWEEVPYWLRGFYPLAVLTGERKLLSTAMEYIEKALASSQEDGWFGPAYLKDRAKTPRGLPVPDLYPNMLLADTLILYHSNTGDPRVITLMRKYVRFCLSVSDEGFLPRNRGRLQWQTIRAGDLMSQLYWYYRQTKDAAALTLAKRVHGRIWPNSTGFVADHAVDFAHRFAYDAIYSQQSGDPSDFARSQKYYEDFAKVWGQMPRGIFAADERIRPGATDPRQAYEPCGMVELAKNFYELSRISGSTEYADRIEDVMLNHFPASFTPDYRQMHYLTSANMPVLDNYYHHPLRNGSSPKANRSFVMFTPNNRCCGHNTGMGWPWYAMNLWQKTADGGLAAQLYAPCQVKTQVNGCKIALTVATDYPFEGAVRVQVDSEGEYPLYFRIPGWSADTTLWVNDEPAQKRSEKGGWLRICRKWRQGDRITLEFGMNISFTRFPSHGGVCVDMGPLTYSVRIPEQYRLVEEAGDYNHPEPHLWENYEVLPKGPWNYGLCPEEPVTIHRRSKPVALQPWTEEAAPVVLKAWVRKIPGWKLQDHLPGKLQKGPIYSAEPKEQIEMIPLGCARLRMSCLPEVTADPAGKLWQEEPDHIPPEERPQGYPDSGWELD